MKNRFVTVFSIFFVTFVLSSIFIFKPVRGFFKKMIATDESKILSVLETKFSAKELKFVKVQRAGQIFIEVYSLDSGRPSLIDKASLGEQVKSAGFKLKEGSSQLFLKEIDGLGFPELVVPIVDRGLKANVVVFSIDEETFKLIKI